MKYYLLLFSATRNVGVPVEIRRVDEEGNFFGFIEEEDINPLRFRQERIQDTLHLCIRHLMVEWFGIFLCSTEFPCNQELPFFIDREVMRASSEGEEITIVIPSYGELLEKETAMLFLSLVGDYGVHLFFLKEHLLCQGKKHDELTAHWLDDLLVFIRMHGNGSSVPTEVDDTPYEEEEQQQEECGEPIHTNTIDIDLLPF